MHETDRLTPTISLLLACIPTIVPVRCEFEDRRPLHLGNSSRDLGDYLRQRNYDMFPSEWLPIERFGTAHRPRCLREYPCDMTDQNGRGNFLGVNHDLRPALRRHLPSQKVS